jgi:hypothetical protein
VRSRGAGTTRPGRVETEAGSRTLGGRRVPVMRPRARRLRLG